MPEKNLKIESKSEITDNIEYRYFKPIEDPDFRAVEDNDGKKIIRGHAAVFNQESKLMYNFARNKEFTEIIEPNAFDDVLASEDLDVVYNRDHNPDSAMGRFRSNKKSTLSLKTDEKGLFYENKLPNTQIANDTYENIKEGILYENSFAFAITNPENEEWKEDDDGNWTRTIKKVDYLFDVATVLNGAYANTDVAIRSLNSRITKEEEKIEENPDDEKEKHAFIMHKLRKNQINLLYHERN